jgi:hypothetical protein
MDKNAMLQFVESVAEAFTGINGKKGEDVIPIEGHRLRAKDEEQSEKE